MLIRAFPEFEFSELTLLLSSGERNNLSPSHYQESGTDRAVGLVFNRIHNLHDPCIFPGQGIYFLKIKQIITGKEETFLRFCPPGGGFTVVPSISA